MNKVQFQFQNQKTHLRRFSEKQQCTLYLTMPIADKYVSTTTDMPYSGLHTTHTLTGCIMSTNGNTMQERASMSNAACGVSSRLCQQSARHGQHQYICSYSTSDICSIVLSLIKLPKRMHTSNAQESPRNTPVLRLLATRRYFPLFPVLRLSCLTAVKTCDENVCSGG